MSTLNTSFSIIHKASGVSGFALGIYNSTGSYAGDLEDETISYCEYMGSELTDPSEEDLNTAVTTFSFDRRDFNQVKPTGKFAVTYYANGKVKEDDDYPTINMLHMPEVTVMRNFVRFVDIPRDSEPGIPTSDQYKSTVEALTICTTARNPFDYCDPSKLKYIFIDLELYHTMKLDLTFKELSKDKGRDIFKSLVAVRVACTYVLDLFLYHFDIKSLSCLDNSLCENISGLVLSKDVTLPEVKRFRCVKPSSGNYRNTLLDQTVIKPDGTKWVGVLDSRLYETTESFQGITEFINESSGYLDTIIITAEPILSSRQKNARF